MNDLYMKHENGLVTAFLDRRVEFWIYYIFPTADFVLFKIQTKLDLA